jgi:hypothetical protein
MKMDVYRALWCEFRLTASKRPEYRVRLAMIALLVQLRIFRKYDNVIDSP